MKGIFGFPGVSEISERTYVKPARTDGQKNHVTQIEHALSCQKWIRDISEGQGLCFIHRNDRDKFR